MGQDFLSGMSIRKEGFMQARHTPSLQLRLSVCGACRNDCADTHRWMESADEPVQQDAARIVLTVKKQMKQHKCACLKVLDHQPRLARSGRPVMLQRAKIPSTNKISSKQAHRPRRSTRSADLKPPSPIATSQDGSQSTKGCGE